VTALYQAFQEGDHARARRLQEAIAPLAVAITATHGVAGLKAAMDLAGFRGGPVREPLRPIKDEVRAELRALLDRAEGAV
jgi:dihydrodipicolinate synthase/N-acetylneuraminate lyase